MQLYILDPDGGNTVGFKPNSLLGPRDAFDLYDEDRSGTLDEDGKLQYLCVIYSCLSHVVC